MQSRVERAEAALLYPEWGAWLDDLERRARRKHGFGWGETKPREDPTQGDLFMPMCNGCERDAA